MSYSHSNHTCGTHIRTFGSYEGKGVGIRTQDCAALIPRESVGLHKGLWDSTALGESATSQDSLTLSLGGAL